VKACRLGAIFSARSKIAVDAMDPTDGPAGMNLRGSLDWLFSVDKESTELEAHRPLGVPPQASFTDASDLPPTHRQAKAYEPWLEGASFADNADLLLDEELLADFKAVPLVKCQLRIKHQERLFEQLHSQELMVAARFSMRCLPAETLQQVVTFSGKTPKVGNVLPKRWLLLVYFEAQCRAKVEEAVTQLGYSISGTAELPAEDDMEQFLAHQHSLGRFSFFAKISADEIEVADGKSLDKDLSEWKQSYEAQESSLQAQG